MERLVIHLEAAGGLALVAARGPKRPPDRLPLHLLGGDVSNLLQREARRRGSLCAGGRCRGVVHAHTRQMLGANDVGGQQDGPSDDVSKLADIPRPGIAKEQLGRLLRYRANGPPEFHARFGQKAVRQR